MDRTAASGALDAHDQQEQDALDKTGILRRLVTIAAIRAEIGDNPNLTDRQCAALEAATAQDILDAMAQKFHVRYLDDIYGTDLGDHANTISFAVEGKEYSIDLSDDNVQAFREAVAPYIEAGHRVTGKNAKTARKATKTPSADLEPIREWAKANGYDVSDRGRIPADVMDAYSAAN